MTQESYEAKIIREFEGKRTNRAFLESLLIRILCIAAGLISSVVLNRQLGPEEAGAYGYVYTLSMAVVMPLYSGAGFLLLSEIPKLLATKAWGEFKGLLLSSASFMSLACLTACLPLYAWLHHTSTYSETLVFLAVLLVPVSSFGLARDLVLRGLGHTGAAQVFDGIFRPTGLAITVLALTLHGIIPFTAVDGMAAQCIGALLALIAGFAYLTNALPLEGMQAHSVFRSKKWLKIAAPFTIIAVIQTVNNSLAVLFLDNFSGKKEIGYFRVAELCSSLIILGLNAVDIVVSPKIAYLLAKNDRAATQTLMSQSMRFITVVSFLIAFGEISLARTLLPLVFGKAFEPCCTALQIFAVGKFFIAITGLATPLLSMAGQLRRPLNAVVLSTLMTAALSRVLIPKYHEIGAVIAMSVPLILSNLYLTHQAWACLKINSLSFRAA